MTKKDIKGALRKNECMYVLHKAVSIEVESNRHSPEYDRYMTVIQVKQESGYKHEFRIISDEPIKIKNKKGEK